MLRPTGEASALSPEPCCDTTLFTHEAKSLGKEYFGTEIGGCSSYQIPNFNLRNCGFSARISAQMEAEPGTSHPPPTASPDSESGAALQAECDKEFARYAKERELTIKNELDAEKVYDSTLLTLSTLAIGTSLTVYKDVVRAGSATPLIILCWISLGICLFAALIDRLFSYFTHKKWRDVMDDEFNNYIANGGLKAWERVLPKYEKIQFVQILPWLKWVCFGTLLAGVVFLMAFVMFSSQAAATNLPASPTNSPVTVNVYNAAGHPTTQP